MATTKRRRELPAEAGGAPGALVRLDQAKGAIARCERVEDAEAGRAEAAFWERWAKEQKRLLAKATLEEAEEKRQEVERVERQAAELRIRWEARLGELTPAEDLAAAGAKGGRGKKAVTRCDGFSREQARRWREVAAARKYLDAYLKRCDEKREEVTRAGLLRYAAERKAAEVRQEAAVAADPRVGADSRKPLGADQVEEHDLEPDEKRGPFEVAADTLLQAAAKLAAARLPNLAPTFLRMRDEAVEDLKVQAGHLVQLGRDVREAIGAELPSKHRGRLSRPRDSRRHRQP